MHESVMQYIREVLLHEDVYGKRVLEVGSYNVNGSAREYIEPLLPSEYIGIDMRAGLGVDVVMMAEDLVERFGPESFDVVVSTQALEHCRDWRGAIKAMFDVCKRGGILVITASGVGYPAHEYPEDYWRFTQDDFRKMFDGNEMDTRSDTQVSGVFVKVVKRTDSAHVDFDVASIGAAQIKSGTVSVIVPSRHRPSQLRKCIKRLFKTAPRIECIAVLDSDDIDSQSVIAELPVIIEIVEPWTPPVAKWNAGAKRATGEWLVTGADDVYWLDGWLEAALSHGQTGFVGLYDGYTDPRQHATHFMLSREYIDKNQHGDLFPRWYKSWFADNEIVEIARRLGVYACYTDAAIDHRHVVFDAAPDDEIYRLGRKYHAEDRRTFYRRQRFGFPNKAVEWGDDIRPIIGVPLERCVPYADTTFWSFIQIAQQGWPFIKFPYTSVDKARNKCAMHLLNSDFTHLVMLDLDHDHPPDIIYKFMRRIKEDPTKQVIGGLNFRRGAPYEPCAFVERDGKSYSVAGFEPGTIMPVSKMGCGSMIIAREVFEQLPGPPWFWNDYSQAHRDIWPGEDVTFCGLCQKHGITIWLDTSITSDHMIDGRINDDVFRAYAKAHQDEFETIEDAI